MIRTTSLDPIWHPKIQHFGLDIELRKHEYDGQYYEYEVKSGHPIPVAEIGGYQVLLPLGPESFLQSDIITMSPFDDGAYLAIMLNDTTWDEMFCGFFAIAQRVEPEANLYVTVIYHSCFHISYMVHPRG